MSASLPSWFAELTFDVLADWSGEAVFQRGLAYHKGGKACNIVLTAEGGLLATVFGVKRYTTNGRFRGSRIPGLAENQIAFVKPKAYVQSAVFLRKMGKLMRRQNMTTQWNTYIQSLRTQYRNRPRLIEILDSIPAVKT